MIDQLVALAPWIIGGPLYLLVIVWIARHPRCPEGTSPALWRRVLRQRARRARRAWRGAPPTTNALTPQDTETK